MLRHTRSRRLPARLARFQLSAAALTVALLASGCSADVARFDSPLFALNESSGSTAAVPTPSAPLRRNVGAPLAGEDQADPAPLPPPDYRGSYPTPASLPPPSTRGAYPSPAPLPPQGSRASSEPIAAVAPLPNAGPPFQSQSRRLAHSPQPRLASAAPSAESSPSTTANGNAIEVQNGDTLYGLAHKHGISMSELMSVNGLKRAHLKPGQRLVLPAGKATAGRPPAGSEPVKLASVGPATAIAASKAAAPIAVAPSTWQGSHTVKAGDSLYAIARQHKVTLDELQRVNAIADPRKVRPGVVLRVPATAGPAVAKAVPASMEPLTLAPEAPRAAPARVQQPTIINAPKLPEPQIAATEGPGVPKPEAAAADAQPAAKLRWPVKGKVIANFGQRPNGSHNDGINLAVPLGTDVHAAEAGVVAYAGAELKDYGNLVLVRHDNGWVTAYAHNEQVLVRRGDKIKRGQVIAKAGNSGTIDQPQLHFELRQGATPVDPLPHMERM